MVWMFRTRSLSFGMLTTLGLLSLSGIALSGCNKSETAADGAAGSPAVTDVDHSHGGWWCVEHGVPEGECALCSTKVAADFKKKGDWCKEHDRPESQCFKCHPELEAKFAGQYEAKYGKQPPKPEG